MRRCFGLEKTAIAGGAVLAMIIRAFMARLTYYVNRIISRVAVIYVIIQWEWLRVRVSIVFLRLIYSQTVHAN